MITAMNEVNTNIGNLSFDIIMTECSAKNKIKGTNELIDVTYEVFKDTNKFVNINIHRYCSKTASDIACWIAINMYSCQTSIELKSRILAESNICKAKSPDLIRKGIKELIDVGAIIRWKDIEGLPDNVVVNKDWYLLNPNMIKAIGCKAFREQVNTTLKCIKNSADYHIHEYSAIVYDFKNNKQ